MTRSIMLVESRPVSSEGANEFHEWYDRVHIPAVLSVDGFVSARRLEAEDGSSFLAMYEIDTDIDTARTRLRAAFLDGRITRSSVMQHDPPPMQRYFRIIGE